MLIDPQIPNSVVRRNIRIYTISGSSTDKQTRCDRTNISFLPDITGNNGNFKLVVPV